MGTGGRGAAKGWSSNCLKDQCDPDHHVPGQEGLRAAEEASLQCKEVVSSPGQEASKQREDTCNMFQRVCVWRAVDRPLRSLPTWRLAF